MCCQSGWSSWWYDSACNDTLSQSVSPGLRYGAPLLSCCLAPCPRAPSAAGSLAFCSLVVWDHRSWAHVHGHVHGLLVGMVCSNLCEQRGVPGAGYCHVDPVGSWFGCALCGCCRAYLSVHPDSQDAPMCSCACCQEGCMCILQFHLVPSMHACMLFCGTLPAICLSPSLCMHVP